MKLKFINNFRILEILEATEIELKQLELLALCEWTEWRGRKMEKFSRSYLHQSQYLPGGFWHKIVSLRKTGYHVSIVNIADFINQISLDEFTEWAGSKNYKYVPHWYQAKGAWLGLKYPISRGDFVTSAGKTFIMFLMCEYLLEFMLGENEKILIVVPSVMLVNQTASDFNDYYLDGEYPVDKIYAGSRRTKDARIIVGSVDSLVNYDLDFFEPVGALLYDEGHKLKTAGYRKIIQYMHNNVLKLIYSASGTFYPAGSAEDFPAESIAGPVLVHVTAKQLMDEGAITPAEISMIRLEYPPVVAEQYYNHEDCNQVNKRYHFEMGFIRSQKDRFMTIYKIVSKLKYNQLLLFKDRKYCEIFYKYLTKHCQDHHVMTIHGDISGERREEIKQFTEHHINVIICATYGTMSTGVSINNLSTLHFIEGSKSFIMVRQSIGRTLRLHESKKVAKIIDYSDIFPKSNPLWGGPKRLNISANHFNARKKIYKNQQFKFKVNTLQL